MNRVRLFPARIWVKEPAKDVVGRWGGVFQVEEGHDAALWASGAQEVFLLDVETGDRVVGTVYVRETWPIPTGGLLIEFRGDGVPVRIRSKENTMDTPWDWHAKRLGRMLRIDHPSMATQEVVEAILHLGEVVCKEAKLTPRFEAGDKVVTTCDRAVPGDTFEKGSEGVVDTPVARTKGCILVAFPGHNIPRWVIEDQLELAPEDLSAKASAKANPKQKFWAGDCVRCVDARDVPERLTEGNLYIAAGINKMMRTEVFLQRDDSGCRSGGSFFAHRFTLVAPGPNHPRQDST